MAISGCCPGTNEQEMTFWFKDSIRLWLRLSNNFLKKLKWVPDYNAILSEIEAYNVK